jgi:nitrate/nitrite-specific signal transduction histidine kinase
VGSAKAVGFALPTGHLSVPVLLDIRNGARLPRRVEVASHDVLSEAVANAAKHAEASGSCFVVEVANGDLAELPNRGGAS